MMRPSTAAFVAMAMLAFTHPAGAEPATSHKLSAPSEMSDQARRRPRVRIYRDDSPYDVSPRYFPGATAKRDCVAFYEREYRPSGTVIVPRMRCAWVRG